MKYQKIINEPDLVKDSETGAVLNLSESSYDKYINERKRVMSEKNRINKLENDVQDIKILLNQIMGKINEINRNSWH